MTSCELRRSQPTSLVRNRQLAIIHNSPLIPFSFYFCLSNFALCTFAFALCTLHFALCTFPYINVFIMIKDSP